MEKQIKIAINGAAGRMGKAIARETEGYSGTIIVRAYDRPDSPDIAKRLCDIGNSKSSVTIEPSDTINQGDFDVLIDFSMPSPVMDAARHCIQIKRPMVIGVTGFGNKQKEKLQTLAEEIPILMSPNMSIGVNLCFRLLAQLSQTPWGKEAHAEIIETHHKSKKDKPSGTALRMGEIIAEEKGVDLSDIPIQSHRESDVTGEHRTFFSLNSERVELRHEAMNRSPFANGAIEAARWLVKSEAKPGRIYTMNDVIELSPSLVPNP